MTRNMMIMIFAGVTVTDSDSRSVKGLLHAVQPECALGRDDHRSFQKRITCELILDFHRKNWLQNNLNSSAASEVPGPGAGAGPSQARAKSSGSGYWYAAPNNSRNSSMV